MASASVQAEVDLDFLPRDEVALGSRQVKFASIRQVFRGVTLFRFLEFDDGLKGFVGELFDARCTNG